MLIKELQILRHEFDDLKRCTFCYCPSDGAELFDKIQFLEAQLLLEDRELWKSYRVDYAKLENHQ